MKKMGEGEKRVAEVTLLKGREANERSVTQMSSMEAMGSSYLAQGVVWWVTGRV